MKRFFLGLLFLTLTGAVNAQSVNLTVVPDSAIEKAVPKVTWNATGADVCTASGGWSGSKPVSGSEVVTQIDRDTTYTIVCVTQSGEINISWLPPTQYTNGTAITDLTGYKIFIADSVVGLSTVTPIDVPNPSVTNYKATGVLTGLKYVVLKSVAGGQLSALSNTPSKDVAAKSVTAQATAQVTPVPKAPVVALP